MRAQITATTDDEGKGWVHVERLSYYILEDVGTYFWCVLDRNTDFAVTKNYKTKRGASAAFRRHWHAYKGRLPQYR